MLCKVCGCADESMFYASIKTHCKEHWKEKVRKNRSENIEHYQELDRKRASMPHRVAARAAYQATEAFAVSHAKAQSKWSDLHPKRRAANIAVTNAVRNGKLKKIPCFECGATNVEAHHPDYDQPLDVVWLCVKHHKEVHAMAKAA